jgi:hypothetical protein
METMNTEEHMPQDDQEIDASKRENLSALLGLFGGAVGLAALTGCEGGPPQGPAESTAATALPWSGASFLWVDSINGPSPNLRDIIGSDSSSVSQPVIVVGGQGAPGDGGGGIFYWDTSLSVGDDNGTIIVPTGSMTGRWRRVYSGVVNVQWFGAKASGSTADAAANATAVQGAMGVIANKKGGTLYFPAGPGEYYLNQPIVVSANYSITIVGDGWYTNNTSTFGSSNWPGGSVTGSVIRMTGATDAIQASSTAPPNGNELVVRDVAFVGSGLSGTYSGLDVTSSTAIVRARFQNVLFADFPVGIGLNVQDCAFHAVTFFGCTTGLLVNGATDTRFYDLVASGCGTGIQIVGGGGMLFVGGVVQGNTTGIDLHPAAGVSIGDLHFTGMWLEANTTAISLNTSNYNTATGLIEFVSFSGMRNGGGVLAWTTAPAYLYYGSIVQVSFVNCDMACPMAIPTFATNVVLVNNRWSSFSDAGWGTQRLAENVSGASSWASNFTGMSGISSSASAARNLAGEVTLVGGSGATASFTFPVAERDAGFELQFTPRSVSGGAAANSWRVRSYAATVTGSPPSAVGFTLTTEADPGAGQSVTFSWLLARTT